MVILFPLEDKDYHNQNKLSHVTEEELLDNAMLLHHPEGLAKVLRWILFFVALGPIRLALLIGGLIVYLLVMLPVLPFLSFEIVKYFTPYGIFCSRCFIRLIAFCFGVFWVNIEGEFEPDTRMICFNHQTLLDGPIIYVYKVFTVISMIEMLKVPIFGKILAAAGTLFIDRSKQSGASQAIKEFIEQEGTNPIGLAPEGKTTQGKFMLKFHTGGFLTDRPFQTVALRYKSYFTFDLVNFKWCCGGFFTYAFRCLSIPFGTLTISISKQHTTEEIKGMTPTERAMMAEFEIANKLGVKATDASNTEVIRIIKEHQQGKKKKD